MDTSSHLERARLLYRSSRLVDCLAVCQEVLAQDPDDAEALCLQGWCHHRSGKEVEALAAAAKAIKADPEWPATHYLMSVVHESRGYTKGAVESAQEALRLDPEDPDFHAQVGDLHAGQASWAKGLVHFDDALKLQPDHERALLGRARCLARLGQQEAADEAAQRALALNPDSGRAHAALGWAALEAGQAREAEDRFLEALRLDPDDADARGGLVESLKARRGIYKPVLRWNTFMARFSGPEQMGMILALAVLVSSWPLLVMGLFGEMPLVSILVEWTLNRFPALSTVGGAFNAVLAKVYLAFVILVWTCDPVLNLILAREKRMRLILRPEELWGAGIFAVLALLALAGGLTNGMAFGWQAGMAAGMALAAQIIVAPSAASLTGLRRWLGVLYALTSLGIAGYGTLLPHLPSIDAGWTSESVLTTAMWTGLLGTWVFNILSWLPERIRKG